MKNFCFALCIALFCYFTKALGSEAGMPQLNPEFWPAQIFWLILIFSVHYISIWKIFLPKISYSIENRKSKVVGDLDEAQKLKESAEKKLNEYNKIIENSKNEAKKIIENSRKKLNEDIEIKKQKLNDQIEKELLSVEKEIKDLKKNATKDVSKIAAEISAEVIKQIIDSEVNNSNVSAIVNDITRKNFEKNI